MLWTVFFLSLVAFNSLKSFNLARGYPLKSITLPRSSIHVIQGKPVTDRTLYPFIVDLTNDASDISGHRFCTGTLIRPNVVLTAAHCAIEVQSGKKMKTTYAVVGRITFEDQHDKEKSQVKVHRVVVSHVYPFYKGLGSKGDVAVMLLEQPVADASVVSLSRDDPSVDSDVVVVGYGVSEVGTVESTGANIELMPKQLMHAPLKVKERDFCDIPGVGLRTHEGMICTTGAKLGGSACHGDSGGPLLLPMQKQVGVVSYGDADCHSADAGVFTAVGPVYDWIQDAADRLQKLPALTEDFFSTSRRRDHTTKV